MVAAPQNAVGVFKGTSGKTYSIDMYLSDVANATVNFDGGGGSAAGSPAFWIPPERVILVDFAIHAGMTDTTKARVTVNGRPTASILRYAIHLDTLATRPALFQGFEKGAQVGLIQLA